MTPAVGARRNTNRVVVLDRDGTIVTDRHYLSDPDQLQFEPSAETGLRKMAEMGLRLVVVTNQSGISRGFFSLARLEQVHQRLRQMMHSIGAPLEGIYFCPHGPGDGCDCRKPGLALMRQAAQELDFDMSESIVIGDKESDIEFGQRAGAITMLIAHAGARPSITPTYVIKDLNQAANIIGDRLASSA